MLFSVLAVSDFYYILETADCEGHDILNKTDATPESCVDECNKRDDCKSFQFLKQSQQCYLKNYVCKKEELTYMGNKDYAQFSSKYFLLV
jgi:hypothetical protein